MRPAFARFLVALYESEDMDPAEQLRAAAARDELDYFRERTAG